eukprot:CAMPEP_0176400840 /NCGR_PEP_ID=MMETSP0126-20121128/47948_1 /TAXON_ID=141414 ORGANISM="Strombidinopsis acuminatum, Strain SPMC142" /NCGR_SAMPLE_ID=MMETSP0126 /ASSEMBLY_ACC=CAM_ASM_000229 /LENGTH=169 /DNA_ID=CAMNT_0017777395 /DNA_START=12 /DNA_END=522 /DNA_ORIENTATION=+
MRIQLETDKTPREARTTTLRDHETLNNKLAPRLGTATGTDALTNVRDWLYYGQVFVGDSKQPVKVVFDTASQWVVIESEQCGSCDAEYDTSASTPVSLSDEEFRVYYGRGHYTVKEYYETICLLDSGLNYLCAEDYRTLIAVDQFGMSDQIGGIVGMTKGTSNYILTDY